MSKTKKKKQNTDVHFKDESIKELINELQQETARQAALREPYREQDSSHTEEVLENIFEALKRPRNENAESVKEIIHNHYGKGFDKK